MFLFIIDMDTCRPFQNSANGNGTAFVPLLEATLELFLFCPHNAGNETAVGAISFLQTRRNRKAFNRFIREMGEPQRYFWLPAVAAELACR